MRKSIHFIVLPIIVILYGCDAISIPPVDDDKTPKQNSRVISCLCNKYNSTTDWIYCDPVRLEINQPIHSAEMIYSVGNKHGSSKVVVELYDLITRESIPDSRIESIVSYVAHPLYSENLASYLKGEIELVIRFRNAEEGAVGYITDNSRLVLVYK